MTVRFLHTADWQLGKRFGRVADPSKQEALRAARYQAIDRLAEAARTHQVDFVLVAGDLFDSPTASKEVISRALGAIGRISSPVLVIPGNHDHGGPGSLWEQPHFRAEQAALAPNLITLLEPRPHVTDKAVILPCPLLRRHDASNPLAWIGAEITRGNIPSGMPRIVLAHGTVQEFGSQRDDEDDFSTANFLDLTSLTSGALDYIALGDWHGTKQVGANAWYPGALEADRFPKNADYQSGQALLVEISAQGSAPLVTPLHTGGVAWHEMAHDFQGAGALAHFETQLQELLGSRVQQDALRFTFSGSVSLEDDARLTELLGRYDARALRLEVRQRPGLQPSEDEIRSLAARPGDPLIAAVAMRLQEELGKGENTLALEALRQLFASVRDLEAGRTA